MVTTSDMVTNSSASVGPPVSVVDKLKWRVGSEVFHSPNAECNKHVHHGHVGPCGGHLGHMGHMGHVGHMGHDHPECRETRLTCRAVVVDYCCSTGMHGVRYFVDHTRSVAERIFWMAAVFVSLCACFFLIEKAWTKWNSSPVIVSFTETPTPMWEVPFPAVTICPIIKVPKRVVNFTDLEQRLQDFSRGEGPPPSEEDIKKHKMMSLLCHTLTDTFEHKFGGEAVDFLQEIAPTLEDVIVECYWRGIKVENCSDLFRPVIAEEGVCFTFNMLNEREIFQTGTVQWEKAEEGRWWSTGWNLEYGYPRASDVLESYPWRSVGIGSLTGLRLVLRAFNNDLDYLCRGAEQGFKVVLHSSSQRPGVSLHHLLLPLNASLLVVAKPTLMTTSDGVRRFSDQTRKCKFPSERALLYYKEYTQENCMFECLANYTLQRCGCVPFFLARFPETLVCSQNLRCGRNALRDLVQNETNVYIATGDATRSRCNCLPTCTSLEYGSEASLTDFPWTALFAARRDDHARLGKELSLSQVTVYFKEFQMITSRRSELYGDMDFLANCGGLLGLFNGFSVLSLVELVYFATLRLWCDLGRQRNRRRRERDIAADATAHSDTIPRTGATVGSF